MKKREGLVLLAILAVIFWPKRTVTYELKKPCTYPDGTVVDVPIDQSCPYDAAHGGQSYFYGV